MDWFKSGLQAAQKQAQEAAEKARALAQQASVQARAIAEQASEQAKVLAEQASEQAKVFAEQATEKAKQASERAKVLASAAAEEAQAKLQQLAAQTTATSSGGSAHDVDHAELAKYGVTPGLLETVSGMTYSTFSDYPVELLPTTNPMGLAPPIPPPGFRLSPWQERHALLVLTRGDQLQGLRFALCPKRMSEEMFWVIYFTLVKTLLPPEAFAAADAPAGAVSGLAKGLGTPSSSAKSLRGSTAVPSSPTMPVSTHSSTARLMEDSTSAAATTTGAATPARAGAASAAAASSAGAASHAPGLGGEAVLVDVGSSNAGEEEDDDDDEEEEDDEEDGAEGGEADLDALEDDPELAAYLEEALDVGEGGEAEGLSDLGSATDDLDDYINQLDAELGAEGGSGSGEAEASPARPVQEAA
ncbi:hypothetical protein PLESTB_001088700 [Pleodorina starrii]|uniref:BSD domain-containing protein n=1 Tax=Pleodorina starrii TaxID=330485 RepID=A0A9W6BQD3_9CHLO|nr:hypothetical protein PLESTM_000697600 [Pleodorina starrii]GLC56289.1 hypothetical protein PLESTB_001088700 [Pleodorina starrii]GLC69633.1 hypothetical protein PLESTF_000857100 [Pleodorina starrii]